MGRLYSSRFTRCRTRGRPSGSRFSAWRSRSASATRSPSRFRGCSGIDPRWGAAGLTASAGIAGWIEFLLLRRALNGRIGATGLAARLVAQLWGAGVASAGLAWAVRLAMPAAHPLLLALAVLTAYGAVYFLVTDRLGIPEARAVMRRLRPEPRSGTAG